MRWLYKVVKNVKRNIFDFSRNRNYWCHDSSKGPLQWMCLCPVNISSTLFTFWRIRQILFPKILPCIAKRQNPERWELESESDLSMASQESPESWVLKLSDLSKTWKHYLSHESKYRSKSICRLQKGLFNREMPQHTTQTSGRRFSSVTRKMNIFKFQCWVLIQRRGICLVHFLWW